jgi:BlaI family penicillinase repressor
MARPRLDPERRRPTEAEASILATLWEHGPSTVRQVHEHLASRQDVGLTTDQAEVQSDMVGDLLDRVFGGSTENLVLRALSTRPSTPEEIAAIRRHLDALDEGDR